MSVIVVRQKVNFNTAVANPLAINIEVPPLRISNVEIGFPAGCVDLVSVWIEYLSAQIFPANSGGVFVGNGQIIGFDTDTTIAENPRVIVVKIANLDDTYDHNIWVKFDVIFLETDIANVIVEPVISVNYPLSRLVR